MRGRTKSLKKRKEKHCHQIEQIMSSYLFYFFRSHYLRENKLMVFHRVWMAQELCVRQESEPMHSILCWVKYETWFVSRRSKDGKVAQLFLELD